MAIETQSTFTFKPLTLWHVPHVAHIERNAYPEPWTFNMLRDEVSGDNRYFCVMYEGETLTGYGGYWMLMDEAHITRVTIVPERRGNGLSTVLMEHIMAKAEQDGAAEIRLEVRENNMPAIRLYCRLGFVEVGRRIGYYQRTNENAIVMVKPVKRSAAE